MTYNSDYDIRLATLGAMGGDMTKKYDSVYDIDLAILRLMQEGGGIGGGIKEVDELPDASENKDKILRLSSDKDIYMAKYSGTTTTDKLPDNEQKDKAYLFETTEDIYHYRGAMKLICTDDEINGYAWGNISEDGGFYFTEENSLDITLSSNTYYVDSYEGWVISGNTAISTDFSTDYVTREFATLEENNIQAVILATYNAAEADQIGNAYLYNAGDLMFYTGEEITLVVSDGQISGLYQWLPEDNDGSGYSGFLTKQRASDIYCNVNRLDDIYFSDTYIFLGADITDGWIKTGNTWTNTELTLSDIEFYTIGDYGNTEIDSVFIAHLNLPDAEQVNDASIYEPTILAGTFYYDGTISSITVGEETIDNVYSWKTGGDELGYFWTNKPASEIYSAVTTKFYQRTDDPEEGIICTNDRYEDITAIVLNIQKYSLKEDIYEWAKVKFDEDE